MQIWFDAVNFDIINLHKTGWKKKQNITMVSQDIENNLNYSSFTHDIWGLKLFLKMLQTNKCHLWI